MAKGGEWEREVSKILSLWWTGGERNDVMWRTHGSGGRATNRAKKGKGTAGASGDLMATHPVAEPLFEYWLAEAKRGYDAKKGKKTRNSESINVLYWLDRPVGTKDPQLYRWWLKADKEREQDNRCEAVIIFRRTGKRRCIMMRAEAFGDLHQLNSEYRGSTIDIRYGHHRFTIMDLEVFLQWCPPESIRIALAERQKTGPTRPKRVLIA
jgi:hypothetical protein